MPRDAFNYSPPWSRREVLRAGLYGIGVSAGLPVFLQRASSAMAAEALAEKEKRPERIMVVVELNGGNDGLNTVVPYGNDEYYKLRPTLGIPKGEVRKISDEFGFHPRMEGFDRLYQDGNLAIVHGCSYPNPNLSHFSAMEYWHTGVPNGADARGWIGRFADAQFPSPQKNLIVNVAKDQSLAVKSRVHAPIIFNDPNRFSRVIDETQSGVVNEFNKVKPTNNKALGFLRGISSNAADSSVLVKEACARYQTPVDYGLRTGIGGDLIKVASLIYAGLPTRVYYVSIGGWDTHANQATTHSLLLIYVADAIRGFIEDMNRMGKGDNVSVMVFTEFGRRVPENASQGTDHGTATPMFIVGNKVKGGMYSKFPSLTDLNAGNLKMTTDFRSVYATMIREWMGYEDTNTMLKGDFPTFDVFA